MKALLAATLLAMSLSAQSEMTEKTVKMVCGSEKEFTATMEKYKEIPIIAAPNMEAQVIYSLWVNMMTGTTSWAAQFPQTNEWCMMGLSDKIIIPDGSPLGDTPIGTRIKFK